MSVTFDKNGLVLLASLAVASAGCLKDDGGDDPLDRGSSQPAAGEDPGSSAPANAGPGQGSNASEGAADGSVREDSPLDGSPGEGNPDVTGIDPDSASASGASGAGS